MSVTCRAVFGTDPDLPGNKARINDQGRAACRRCQGNPARAAWLRRFGDDETISLQRRQDAPQGLPTGGYGVVLTLRDVMTSGPIGKVPGARAVRKSLTGVTLKRRAGLEHHAKTGQDDGQGFFAKAA